MQTDEYIFFDRVRRYLDNREVYDEFLRLINLFTQGFIDGRTLLLRSEEFLGSSEHMLKFRDIVGMESQDPSPNPAPTATRLKWDHNMKAVIDMGYRSAYKKLSPGAVKHNSTCQCIVLTSFVGSCILLWPRCAVQLSVE
jgi:hypothetical protein